MKIGLMGCEFTSPNKGCEALTYSFISILNDIMRKDEITIYNFSGTEIGYFTEKFPNINFINVYPKLKDFSFKYIKALKNCDIIFDVTMGDSFSDIYSTKYYNWLIVNKKIAELCCKNYVLLPQTYGPYNVKKSLRRAIGIIKKAKKVYSRDELSKTLLEKNGIRDVKLVTDMAFMLPYDNSIYNVKKEGKILLGINISGLLYKGGFNSDNQFNLTIDYKKMVDSIISKYSNNPKYEVHIIPHVIGSNNSDDDYETCKFYSNKYKQCILAPKFKTPVEAKSYISNMDIFIGSRMHATIAAFSSGVFTIPVSYSRKFEGLFNSLDYKYTINGKKLNTEEVINTIGDYIDKKDTIKEAQKKAAHNIDRKNTQFKKSIKEIVNEIAGESDEAK